MIPFFGAGREFKAYGPKAMALARGVLSGGRWLQSEHVSRFEARLAAFTGRRFGVAVNSCTDALYFALVAAGVKPGDEVLVTDYSFVASASPILRAGAVPVFVDIDSDHLMDLEKTRALAGPKTKALVLVHLYGQMADPKAAEAFAKERNLILIEDAAQAIGAARGGRAAGSLGLASTISFDPTKPISAPGSGGMLLTDDEETAARVRRLRYHGKAADRAEYLEPGFNCQMPSLTAALLDMKMDFERPWLKARRKAADAYRSGLSGASGLVLPREIEPGTHIYHKFVVRHPRRDDLRRHLSERGIETMVHYSLPLHKQPCFKPYARLDDLYPRAMAASREALSLPMHPFLTARETAAVVKAVLEFTGV